MKKILFFMTLILCLTGFYTNTTKAQPWLLISSFNVQGDNALPGKSCNVDIILSNSNNKKITNIKLSIENNNANDEMPDNEPIIIINSGVQSSYIEEIAAGDDFNLILNCTISPYAKSGNHQVNIKIDYQYDGITYTTTDTVILKINEDPSLQTSDLKFEKNSIMVSKENTLQFNLYNNGNCDVYNINAYLEGDTIESESTYIRTIQKDSQSTISVPFVGSKVTENNKEIMLVITYEDSMKNNYKIETKTSFVVLEYTTGTYDAKLYNSLKESDKNNSTIINIILVITFVLLIIVLFLIMLYKKNQNSKSLLK